MYFNTHVENMVHNVLAAATKNINYKWWKHWKI